MPRFSALLSTFLAVAFVAISVVRSQPAAQTVDDDLATRFTTDVLPFLKSHCLSCHGLEKQEAKLDLSGFKSAADVVKNHRIWETFAERLATNEDASSRGRQEQPTAGERQGVITWIRDLGDREARRNAGDPGLVLARRLSNAEYDYSIRDLTGVDIRPTREFPVDPANEAGFDNSGESLTMSPALLKKYLEAARFVADHVVLKPEGLAFFAIRIPSSLKPIATTTAFIGSSISISDILSITPIIFSRLGDISTALQPAGGNSPRRRGRPCHVAARSARNI